MIRFAVQVLKVQAKSLTPLVVESFGKDSFKEKGRGDEEVYFSREEKKTLERLLKKLGDTPSKEDINEDKEELQQLFSRYKVPVNDGLVEELLRWKNSK